MDAKLGAFFSGFVYNATGNLPDEHIQAGWVEEPADFDEQEVPGFGYDERGVAGAYRVFRNPITEEVVFAFKGTNNFAELLEDIGNQGRVAIGNMVTRATVDFERLSNLYPEYSFSAVGHSLGGGASQTFAVAHSTSAYVYNSLPLSEQALTRFAIEEGVSVSQLIAVYKTFPGVRYVSTNYLGDIAGTFFRTIQGGTYLDDSPSTIDSNVNRTAALASFGSLILNAAPAARLLAVLIGFFLPKAIAHPIDRILDAMDELGVDFVTGRVIGGNVIQAPAPSLPPAQEPQVLQHTGGAATVIQFDDGSILRLEADGSVTAEAYDGEDHRISELHVVAGTNASGEEVFDWEAVHYDADGEITSEISGTTSEKESSFEIERDGVVVGEYSVTADQTVIHANSEGDEVEFAFLPDGTLTVADVITVNGQELDDAQSIALANMLNQAGVELEDIVELALDDGEHAEVDLALTDQPTMSVYLGDEEELSFNYGVGSGGSTELLSVSYAGEELDESLINLGGIGAYFPPALVLDLDTAHLQSLGPNEFEFESTKDGTTYGIKFRGDVTTLHIADQKLPDGAVVHDLQMRFYPLDVLSAEIEASYVQDGHQSLHADGSLILEGRNSSDGATRYHVQYHVGPAETHSYSEGYGGDIVGTATAANYGSGIIAWSEQTLTSGYLMSAQLERGGFFGSATNVNAVTLPSGFVRWNALVSSQGVEMTINEFHATYEGFDRQTVVRSTSGGVLSRAFSTLDGMQYSEGRAIEDPSALVYYEALRTDGWGWFESHGNGLTTIRQSNPDGETWTQSFDEERNGEFVYNGSGTVVGQVIGGAFFVPMVVGEETVLVQVPYGYTGGHSSLGFSLEQYIAPIEDIEPIVDPTTLTIELDDERSLSSFVTVSDVDSEAMQAFELRQVAARVDGARAVLGETELSTSGSNQFGSLADVSIRGGDTRGLDQFWIRAFDGVLWSGWVPLTVRTALPDALPVTALPSSVEEDEAIDISAFYSLQEGELTPVFLRFRDDTATSGSGFLEFGGAVVEPGVMFDVTWAELSELKFRGGSDWGVTDHITVQVFNGEQWSDWASIPITTQEAQGENQPPVLLHALGDQTANEDSAFSFTVPQDSFSDEDTGDVLDWFAERADGTALPAWLSFDAVSRHFSGTPLNEDVGSYELRVTAADTGGASASDVFRLEVTNVNDAPIVAQALGDRSIEAGSTFSFAVPAGAFTDPDAGDALALSASQSGGSSLPSWIAFDPATATFTGTAGSGLGAWNLQVTATDAAGEAVSSDFALIVRAVEGSSASGGSGNDILHGGAGDETLVAKGGSDYVFGDEGDDLLRGGNGNDVLQGGEGADVLRSGNGQNLLDGGSGDDVIHGGQGAGFLVGGTGNDTIRVGRGNDVIAFNAGDGVDTLYGGRDGGNTLSFGGGIGYSDLSFSKTGHDLVVNAGANDRVVLKNWYRGNHSVLNLQLIADAMEDFDPTSSDPLYSRKVQIFDMWALVAQFDQAIAANPYLDSWSLMNGLAGAHASASDDAALGGDLAYWYGKNGTLGGIGLWAAQDLLGAPGFGSDAQTLRPFTGLQEGFLRLA